MPSVRLSSALSLTALAIQGLLSAQAVASPMERIEVTGSRIKQVSLQTATPVLSLSREEMAAKGFNSLQQALENLTQNAGGAMTQQEGLGFTPASSAINLRGVGISRVLVLMDGVRMPNYPFGASGTDSFVDLANIPLSAIERVDVLLGGASAIYGSDAMGGVINIITRKHIDATSVDYRFSDTQDGGLRHQQLAVATGTKTRIGHLSLAMEYDERQALHASDRPQWGTDAVDGNYYAGYSSFGANLVGLNDKGKEAFVQQTLTQSECEARGFVWLERGEGKSQCGYDRAAARDLLPQSKRVSAMLSLSGEIAAEHQWYVRANLADTRSRTELESAVVDNELIFTVAGNTVTVADSAGWGLSQSFDKQTGFGGDFATAADGSYKYKRRLNDLGPRVSDFDGKTYDLVAGLSGALSADIDYDLYWHYGRQQVTAAYSGAPTVHGVFDYVTSGEQGQSLLAQLTASDAAAMNFTGINEGMSSLQTLHAGVSGDSPWQLPGGMLAFAGGLEFSQERFFDDYDDVSRSGAVIGKQGASAAGERDQYAAYLEARLPLHEQLTLTLAGRYDYYADSAVGGEFSPQVALEYRPLDSLLLRASWAETFRAPDLHRLYGEPNKGFRDLIDHDGSKAEQVAIWSGSNPELEAETGDNLNLGLVFSQGGVDASIDYWQVNIEGMIASPSAQYILDHEDIYGDRVVRDADGKLVSINSRAVNMSANDSAGIDMALGYRVDTRLGQWDIRAQATYLTRWERRLTPFAEVIDMLNDEDSVPKWQANLDLGWQYGAIESHILVAYLSPMNAYYQDRFVEAGMTEEYDVTLDSHTQVNWSMGYQLSQGIKLTAGINNLFDAQPELDGTSPQWPHYPRSFYNPVGREYYAGISLNF
ncbi:TonB-dependent receptor plug domain-containing protein [Shewanella sp. GXUN23E]|uniref:TonB-dependent receptor plug domain-containing protein n=1 Tax=Shewanella sp. GXUN23E TaxID=3422498 RepID=UPI003D7C6428